MEQVDLTKVNSVRSLQEAVKQDKNINKLYLIAAYGFCQYAEGITGITYTQLAFKTSDGSFFTSREQASEAKIKYNLKSFKVKGRKNEGYGSVGQEVTTVKIMSIKTFLAEVEEHKGFWGVVNYYTDFRNVK